ncbi:peptide/nickel transport system permease protein [Arcanobacterium wilhelmae]|uniref:Oligopeptide transport system permease protein OppC n=1 Tax=Arcanobacterium wilhelmae TaxID=1803177 RepID=A0ABT9NC65_9ACTO|nr:ABC transporter permease [Arcanobacterium wilhelmae]MDP9801312.1 peptide/nickel transport system permease protein [Arcanobacterium wilhelmae]WFN90653.1 ABC transporter permease [Arcanobacterium wilhelmae]
MMQTSQVAEVKAALSKQSEERAKNDKRYTRNQLIRRRFLRSKSAVGGLIGLVIIILAAIVVPYVLPWSYDVADDLNFLTEPGIGGHVFGTNQGGYDMLAVTMEGLRKSLMIGFAVAAVQVFIAAIVGASIAYFGGWADKVGTWVIDLLLVLPSFLMIAVISQRFAGSKSSTLLLIILLAVFSWMLTARVVRALTMSIKNLDYVHAAKYMSVPSFVVIVKHILPNISSLLIIDFTLSVAGAVLSETSLSFFGFGVQKPEVSLGSLIGDAQTSALTQPWLFLPPAGALVLMLLCVNFVGDGLRDAIDPSSKSGGDA